MLICSLLTTLSHLIEEVDRFCWGWESDVKYMLGVKGAEDEKGR